VERTDGTVRNDELSAVSFCRQLKTELYLKVYYPNYHARDFLLQECGRINFKEITAF